MQVQRTTKHAIQNGELKRSARRTHKSLSDLHVGRNTSVNRAIKSTWNGVIGRASGCLPFRPRPRDPLVSRRSRRRSCRPSGCYFARVSRGRSIPDTAGDPSEREAGITRRGDRVDSLFLIIDRVANSIPLHAVAPSRGTHLRLIAFQGQRNDGTGGANGRSIPGEPIAPLLLLFSSSSTRFFPFPLSVAPVSRDTPLFFRSSPATTSTMVND